MLSYDEESLFQEIIAQGRHEGVTTQSAYDELIDEVIEGHRRVGEIHDDNPTEDMDEQLRGRWPDYEAALELKNENPQF